MQPVGTHGGEFMYFERVCFRDELGFLNCDDICMCVVNKQFELLEFVFDSVYVDMQYDEISLQRTQNEALRSIAGSHKMSSIDHLHSEIKMLLVEDNLSLLSAQYLVHCLDTENVCHHISTLDHPPREMKETLFTRHNQTVLSLLVNTKKASLQAVHTSFVNTAIDNMTDNRVLNYRPPPISDEKFVLPALGYGNLPHIVIGYFNSP